MGAVITRRRVLGGAAGAVASWPLSPARADTGLPAAPVELKVMDAVGGFRQTLAAFMAYRRAKPDLVSRITFGEEPAPKVPGTLKAQEDAGRAGFDLVLAGPAPLSAGIDQGIWQPLLPDFAGRLPDLEQILLRPAWDMQRLARGQGVVVSYSPSGPLLEYVPSRVNPVPGTAEELLAWARAHPKRFMYARPAKSEAGRTLLMGLPYLLGDVDPRDPRHGWDKTWAYLQELGAAVAYYPAGDEPAFTQLRQGLRDMVATTMGSDMEARVLGALPGGTEVAALKGLHWISDAHYVAVPKGLPSTKLAVLLDLISFLLTKQAQAFAYEFGSFYPGPAVAGVTLAMAPARVRERLRGFERPQYDSLIADNPAVPPLREDKLAYALRRWDEQVGRRSD